MSGFHQKEVLPFECYVAVAAAARECFGNEKQQRTRVTRKIWVILTTSLRVRSVSHQFVRNACHIYTHWRISRLKRLAAFFVDIFIFGLCKHISKTKIIQSKKTTTTNTATKPPSTNLPTCGNDKHDNCFNVVTLLFVY